MPKSNKKCTYSDSYNSQFPWVKLVPADIHSAFCIWCRTTIRIDNMGKSALESHEKGKKHVAKFNVRNKNASLLDFNIESSKFVEQNVSDNRVPNSSKDQMTNAEINLQSTASSDACNNCLLHCKLANNSTRIFQSSTNEKLFLSNDVTKTEIFCCLNGVMRHSSLHDIESFVSVSKVMFHDSEIVKKMKLGKDKAAYVIAYGISSYFLKELRTILEKCDVIVVGFDECLNSVSQRNQMDISIRYWDKCNKVSTRYWTSAFLGHTTAHDLLLAFKDCLPEELRNKIIQISMDGPNVNLRFFNDLQADFSENQNRLLLNLGCCGLHVISGAFKTGIESSKWDLISFLRALYNFFKNQPARFCGTRWLENVDVAKRTRTILPSVKLYVEKIKKDKRIPQSKSFQTILNHLQDKLLEAKLTFFEAFACELQPFLTMFQSNEPMVPFLYDNLLNICKNILRRFVKEEVLEKADLAKLDLKLEANLIPVNKVNLGYATKRALDLSRGTGASSLEILHFQNDCRKIMQKSIEKILSRSPLKYPMVKAASFLDPDVALSKSGAQKRLSIALKTYVDKRLITGSKADKIEREFLQICSLPSSTEKFKNYHLLSDKRLDNFWTDLIITHKQRSYEDLFWFVKSILILSHGNAALERGFSVNKEMLVENQKEKSLIAQRIIYDSVKSSVVNVEDFVITKSLILCTRNAYGWYKETLAKEKEKIKVMETNKELQMKTDKAVDDLKLKKQKVMKEALNESA